MKYILMLLIAIAVTGCGGGGDTYTQEAPLEPGEPTNGDTIIVQADNGATGVVSYTSLEDGSILVECGDGDGQCGVFVAQLVDEATDTNETEG